MNSIVQEASSIAKAVEQAWKKAEEPHKFSVRIFQNAEKNFLGMTSQPAKIALLFEPKDIKDEYKKNDTQKNIQKQKDRIEKPSPKRFVKPQVKQPSQPINKNIAPKTPTINKESKQQTRELWNDEMVAIARNWMKDILIKMRREDITFTTENKRYHLRFIFNKPLADTDDKQKNVFRNFAHLTMQTVRNRLKKQLRYHKVVISSDK
ncbi:hypothetical protein KAH94_00310 [bacterium]|nr:hypothetical protein [bacterium]